MSGFKKAVLGLFVGLVMSVSMMDLAVAGPGVQRGNSARGPASQGNAVLPATANPLGYSLHDMARLTAPFNVTNRTGPLPNTPFQILYQADNAPETFRVGQGTFLYMPLAYNDDSPPVIGDFPQNVENRSELLSYWFSQSEWGSVVMDVFVDGKLTSLGGQYLASIRFDQPLPDGARQYMTPAVFIHPLPPGAHTVGYHIKATGDAFRKDPISQYFPDGFFEYEFTYRVVVY